MKEIGGIYLMHVEKITLMGLQDKILNKFES